MPVGRQEALIVLPRGLQVGPGAVGGVITPRSLVQHGDGRDEEEEEEPRGGWNGGDGNIRWERKVGGEAKEEEKGEACGRKVGERAGEEREACGEIYEGNVRSAPSIHRMKQKACVEKKEMCEADKRVAGMALPNCCFWP